MASLTDLFEFLSSPNPSARQIALQNLVGHTPNTAAQRHIFVPSILAPLASAGQAQSNGASGGGLLGGGGWKMTEDDGRKVQGIRDLMGMCRDQGVIAHDALSALINLSDSFAVARHIADDRDYLVWLVSYTANPTSPLSPLTSMLLSNLTSHTALLPSLASLTIPVVPLPQSKTYPPYYLTASASASSFRHPDFRDRMLNQPDAGVGQGEEVEVEGLRALVQAFEDGAGEGVVKGTGKRKGECHFLASVFANVSTLPATRSLLLTPYSPFPNPSTFPTTSTTADASTPSDADMVDAPAPVEPEPLLSKLTPHTSHPDIIRRGGCLGAIKNIALDRGCHAFLLAGEGDRVRLERTGAGLIVRGVDVLPAVLGPLMGGEEYDMEDMEQLPVTLQFLPPDKQREQDSVLRMMCVEILLLLSTSYTGRETLRKRGAYLVVRELHKVEKERNIVDAIERLVGLLQGDEGRETKDDLVEELVKDHAPVRAGTVNVAAEDVSAPQAAAIGEDEDVVEV
ncbi:putative cytoplasm protein [Dioszegia hungarica]|uniref:Cytoplasm protein n=1 Tax=Dioszegia hungarica TaxID=4972 RepID=A0AA38H6V7_9TREE|nr:putative cytoplasm protein [Dioszegia hungarica]KAI9633399.1 putative cytoplasm protein [Dioszegia hungarica]